MRISNHFTRGGQLSLHRLRMFKQIIFSTVLITILCISLFLDIRLTETRLLMSGICSKKVFMQSCY